MSIDPALRLLHYSKFPFFGVNSSPQRLVDYLPPSGKPRGLWVSVEGEDDWAQWCQKENFPLGNFVYEIELAPKANLLFIRNAIELDLFTQNYGKLHPSKIAHEIRAIQWSSVARDYQGIIIAPYIWSRRLTQHTFWYYGWDCASGCIWDAQAIESITLIGTLKETQNVQSE